MKVQNKQEKPFQAFPVGNFDIRAERNISFMNETKRYKILPRPKCWVQKNFQILLPNFRKDLIKSCLKFPA